MASRAGRRALRRFGLVAGLAAGVALGIAGCSLDSSGGGDDVAEAGLDQDATRDAREDVDARAETGGDATLDAADAADGMDATDATLDASDAADARDASDAADASDASDARDSGKDGCAPVESNCLDGIDNDCNGLVDCADPACTAGFRCVTPPATWTGLSQYQDGRVACPSTSPTATDTFETLVVPPASCTACQCSASGVTCAGPATIQCGPAGACTTASTVNEKVGATCAPLSLPAVLGPGDACNVAAPAASGGSCAVASGGVPNGGAPSFSKLSRVCGGTKTGGGCAGGGVCVARTPLSTHGLCVARAVPDGAAAPACPAGYPSAHVTAPTAASFVDARTCSACGCGALSGSTCAARVTLYSGGDCTAADAGAPILDADLPEAATPQDTVSVDSDLTCHPVASTPSTFASGIASFVVVAQGTCATTGGAPQGTATAKGQTEYCCEK